MTLRIPPTYYHVAWHLICDSDGGEAVCTAGFHYNGSTIGSDYGALGTAFGRLMQSVQDSWLYTGYTVSEQDGAIHVGTEGSQGGGTSHPAATNNTTFILNKLSSRPGRMGRGRMFLPGVSEQDVAGDGAILPSKQTELQTNLNLMNQDLQGGKWVWQILHNEHPTKDDFPTPVTELKWSLWCGFQDRRLRRGH